MIKLTPIIPQAFNEAKFKHELIEGMRDLGVLIRENFEDTSHSWNHKPKFEPSTSVPKVGINIISVETLTDDTIYGYVSEGTKSHPIFPVKAKRLAFPGTFIPKTFPGIVGSGVGYSGSVDQFRDWVAHPGIEPRKFDEQIKNKLEKDALGMLTKAFSLAIKASGHFLR